MDAFKLINEKRAFLLTYALFQIQYTHKKTKQL